MINKNIKLYSRDFKKENTIIKVGKAVFGNGSVVTIAGPCAVESEDQTIAIAKGVAPHAQILRGGAYKPRTSPHDFQGLKEDGLKILAEARKLTGLPFVTEVVDTETFDMVEEYADLLQIGARNMQNYSLLKRAGISRKPILLKRGMCATIDEWLNAADYILAGGNINVILCERGIRTSAGCTRNTLDVAAVLLVKQKSHLPIIVDPSHSAGLRELVPGLARAAIAVGADGLIMEVHNNPDSALCDGRQSLTISDFNKLCKNI